MDLAADLDELLAKKASLASRVTASPQFGARLAELQSWQVQRLSRTYKDLRADARYSAAVDFFLSDLYGPHDFSPRDRELTRAWRYLKRTLPAPACAALERAIELDVLSTELDHSMVEVSPASPVTGAGYATAYRAVGRADARARQIDLVLAIGEDLDHIVRHAWLGSLLHVARAPARAAGFRVLQDFLERGFRAFERMPDGRPFLTAIRERETQLMRELFAGAGGELFAAAAEVGHPHG